MIPRLELTSIPQEEEALRDKVRGVIAEALAHVPASERARSWLGYDAAFSKKLGEAGLLGLTLPKDYGGAGRSAFARFVAVEELLSVGAPVAGHWIGDRQSAPLILRFGTEEQKRRYIPAICKGDAFFCIGMSEPGSGSDLASVRTRATKTEKGWRINGQKIWTTIGHHAHYSIALVRTSGEPTDRHKGLSQFVIDLSLAGITRRPIRDLTGDEHFSEMYFDDVEVSDDALLGNEGDGWAQVTAELAYERSGPERIYSSNVLLDKWIDHLKASGRLDAQTKTLVGRLTAEIATLRQIAISVTAMLQAGHSPVLEASLMKDLGTSFEQALPTLIADDLAAHPDEAVDPDLLRTLSFVTQMSPAYSLRGGTREILRGIIARGLGLR